MYFGYLLMIPIDSLADNDLEVPVVNTVTGSEVKYGGAVEMQVKLGYDITGIHRGVPALVLNLDGSMPTRPAMEDYYCLSCCRKGKFVIR